MLAALIGFAGLLLPTTALAAFPGKNGRIAFSNIEDGTIETINPDGSGRTTLVSDGGHPAWSPSGDKVAFVRGGLEGQDIYVADADGSGQTQLTSNPAHEVQPAWSPDGSKIVFSTDRDGNWEIYTMNADGSSQTRITNSPDREDQPAWSPSGDRIAFFTRPQYRIYTMNVDGTGMTLLPTAYYHGTPEECGTVKADYAPNWSPDGQKLAFAREEIANCTQSSYYEIHTINADGTGERNLISNENSFILRDPIWSPDGTRIMVEDDSYELFLIDLDGNRLNAVATYPPSPCCADWQPLRPHGYARPRATTPTTVKLVPSYDSCTSPNGTHGAPLAVPSCDPPRQTSAHLTVGSPGADAVEANSTGFVKFRVACIPLAPGPAPPCRDPGDQGDVELTASITDVRRQATMLDYAGELRVSIEARITDRLNDPGAFQPATVADTSFSFNLTCQPTDDTAIGSECSAQTSADAVMPGIAREEKRAIWQLGQVKVYDGGADGDADTAGDNTLFMEQGLFVP